MKDFVEIAVDLPVEGTFTYSLPADLKPQAHPGKRAIVPFGKRTITGYIISLSPASPAGVKGVKQILDIIDEEPLFDEKRLKFFKWLSSYYFAPIGAVLALAHPGGANIKGHRHFTLSKPLPEALQGISGFAAEVIEAISICPGVTLYALLKRFRGKPLYSTVARLKKEGLISEELRLRGGLKKKTEDHFSLKRQDALPELVRSPIQAKVYSYLLKNGTASQTGLIKALGNTGPALKKLHGKGLVDVEKRELLRDPLSGIAPRRAPFEPNEEQKKAIDEIIEAIHKNTFSPFLLYGVTGSGKTLVYLKALEAAINAGKRAIFLTPEIALTPWPAAYLAEKFPGRVALYHSGLSEGERGDEWVRIIKGRADIVVGARSALFPPVRDLGLIIVDEEHETSYKQEDGVRYNARDAALKLGQVLGITVVLGSATPSLESFHNAKTGKLKLLSIRKRVEQRALPEVEIVDMRGQKGVIFSERLISFAKEAVLSGHQALFFLNRRGFSSSVICKDCGYSFSCLNCSVTLTMHKRGRALKCHYCDFSINLPEECPGCKGTDLVQPGAGTERIEDEVKTLFPGIRAGRMDKDTTRKKGSAKKIIDAVEDRKIDLLVGTQMVSKGHHFPAITLVGVISGDTSLNIPDFRSSERTFQLITQAAGRAGRGEAPGKVVIQTLNPRHYCFVNAVKHDYDGFYREEIELREEALYPPFIRLCNLRIEGTDDEKTASAAIGLLDTAERLLKKRGSAIRVLGPSPAMISKLKGRFRWQMLVKGREIKDLHAFIQSLKASFEAKKAPGISLIIDIDPLATA